MVAVCSGNIQFSVEHSWVEGLIVKFSMLTLAALIVLSGCSGETARPDEAAPQIDPPRASPVAPGPCDVTTERAISATIGTQIDAFRAGDFEVAYNMAAPAFQASVSLERFEAVIVSGYASLLDAQSHRLSDCVVFPQRLANTVVTVRTTSGSTATYYYEMVNTDVGWRVLGAKAIAPVGTNT